MIGEISIIDNLPSYASAYAIVDSTLYKISKNYFLDYMTKNTTATNYIMRNLANKVRLMNSEIEYFSKDALSRIAIVLISLCIQSGVKHENEIKISIRFTHEELANLTGLNRVTVSKKYQKLFNKKIISKKDGYIIINNVDKLKKIIT